MVNRPVVVTQHTHIHPTSVYLYDGRRWVAYSDGTAVRCGSGGRDVERIEVVESGTEQGVPSAADVENAAYPVGGVEAGDGSSSVDPIVAVAAGTLGLSAAGTGAYAWHRLQLGALTEGTTFGNRVNGFSARDVRARTVDRSDHERPSPG